MFVRLLRDDLVLLVVVLPRSSDHPAAQIVDPGQLLAVVGVGGGGPDPVREVGCFVHGRIVPQSTSRLPLPSGIEISHINRVEGQTLPSA